MLMMWKHSFSACRVVPIAPQEYLDSFIDLFLRGLLSDATAPASDLDHRDAASTI